jgi:hypothetical protein
LKKYFSEINLINFWKDSKYALEKYVCDYPTDEIIASVEYELGYKLPYSYIELMKSQNGGIPKKCAYPTKEPTSWAEDHIAISGIKGIGRKKIYSLCGELGSIFEIDEWGYPDIGIYFGDCPSAGHDMICLDYRKNGKGGEPEVVHVDQEFDYKITFLAPTFEVFVKGLVSEDYFDISTSEKKEYLWKPEAISFELKQADKLVGTGLMLELNQTLAEGETGWIQSRLNVPESWKNATLKMKDGKIQINVNDKDYYIGKENEGKISFEILNAGKVSDEELDAIWNKYASKT